MTITKWLMMLGLLVLCTACDSGTDAVEVEGRDVPLPNGRTVVCVVVADASNGGTGISCDWSTK